MKKLLILGIIFLAISAAHAQESIECTMYFKHGHSQTGDCEKLRKLLEKRGFIKVQIEPSMFDTEEKKWKKAMLREKALHIITLKNLKERTLEDYALFPENQ